MFSLDDTTLALSATDLTSFLACGHLAAQKLAVARQERAKPRAGDDPHVDLIRRHGDAHEAATLQRLSTDCGGHTDLTSDGKLWVREDIDAAAAATAAAMRAGEPLIFQATFFDGRWLGRTDFLRRVEHPSALGAHAYEVLDTKLARHVKPSVVHQLSLYSRLVGQIQGVELPRAHVILGDGTTETVTLARYAALHRRAVVRVEQLAAGATPVTLPEPVPHCGICDLGSECHQYFVDVDHLSLVAFAARSQRDKLTRVDITTVAALAAAPARLKVPRLGDERYDLLRHQAGLQVRSRETGLRTRRHLTPVRAHGLALLPDPDAGDLFFDLEGDPYVGTDGGIEYLWGWCDAAGGYTHVWAHDEAAEKAALEQFVDLVQARRRRYPRLRVFHYAPHERSKLTSLALKYATREDELDDILRDGVLVDLYAVVRQAIQVGEESYSLKKLERHHGFQRLETSVREGGGSIVAYEQWLEDHDAAGLESIRAYNEEDCVSTLRLRDWLWTTVRDAASAEFAVDFSTLRDPEPEDPPTPPAWLEEIVPIVERLTADLPGDPTADDGDEAERRLLAHLLRYHQREGKPEWWRHFALKELTPVELEDERDAIGSLAHDPSIPPTRVKRSLDHAYTFPPQEFKLRLGDVIDPVTDEQHRLVRATDTHIWLRRGATKPPPSPAALIPRKPIDPEVLRERIATVAGSVLDAERRFAAVRAVVRREPPRLVPAVALREDLDGLIAATLALDHSYLAVQGPPGTGKTYRAARMIVAALKAARRVAVSAGSHAAIQNLLDAVEDHAAEIGYALDGVYRGEGYESRHGLIAVAGDNPQADAGHHLVAGTPWLLAREEHVEQFDLVFVDEAGQFSLANLVAVGACAENIVLLGDPQQLPQVNQAEHPGGSGASALGHLLDGAHVIAAGRGVLLRESWRMHPNVCTFISERSYDGELRSRDACANRRVDAPGTLTGAGLRVLEVEHEGCSQASDAEAAAIAAACTDLLRGTVTDADGTTRKLTGDDIMVVAPYNLAVHRIRDAVPAGIPVGTVDSFQGREAPVVFFAMTCSTGHDVPRGLDFLFNRNRLNVAISRAQCLAVLVHNPGLLDAECPTLEAMELVDGACRFVEMRTL